MKIAIIGILGLVIGVLIGKLLSRPKTFGTLRVDRSDPSEGPYLFLELDTDVNSVMNEKYVIFKVLVENYLPHK